MNTTIYVTPTSINTEAHSKVDLSIIPTNTEIDKYVSFAEYINFGKLQGFGINRMPGTDYYWNNADKEITWPEFVEVLNKIINKLYDEATSGGTGKQNPILSWSRASDTIENGNINQYNKPTLNKTNGITVTFTSSNTDVATVDTSGVILLVGGIGSATITATFAGNDMYYPKTATYTITVNQAQSINDIYIGFLNPNDNNVGKNVSSSELITIDETTKRRNQFIDVDSDDDKEDYLYVLIPNNWNYKLDKIPFGSGYLMFSQITSNDINYTLYKTDSTLNGASDISFIFKIKNATPDDNPQEDDGTIYVEFGNTFGDTNNIKYTLDNGILRNVQANLYEYMLEGYDSINNQYLYIKLNNGDNFDSVRNSTRESIYECSVDDNDPSLYRSNQPFTASSGVTLYIYVKKTITEQ